jgi:hypothetical protein
MPLSTEGLKVISKGDPIVMARALVSSCLEVVQPAAQVTRTLAMIAEQLHTPYPEIYPTIAENVLLNVGDLLYQADHQEPLVPLVRYEVGGNNRAYYHRLPSTPQGHIVAGEWTESFNRPDTLEFEKYPLDQGVKPPLPNWLALISTMPGVHCVGVRHHSFMVHIETGSWNLLEPEILRAYLMGRAEIEEATGCQYR